jgi:hypothetical protein
LFAPQLEQRINSASVMWVPVMTAEFIVPHALVSEDGVHGSALHVGRAPAGSMYESRFFRPEHRNRRGRSARSRLPSKWWIYFRAVSLQPHETSSSGSALGVVKMYS